MSSSPILELLILALGITKKILDRMPSYAESKKEELYQLSKLYEDEVTKEYSLRDDNLCDVYRHNLLLFLRSFSDAISRENLAALPRRADEGTGAKE